jgi:hypothetical protein
MFYFKGLFLEAEYYNILNPFIYNKMFQQIVKGTESNSIIDQTTSGLLGFIDLNYYNNLVEIFQQYAQNLNNSFKDNEYIISLDLSGRLIYLNLFTYASLVSENTKEKFDNTLKNISAIIDSCITLASALSCTGRLCENLKYKAIMLYYLGDDKYKDILKSQIEILNPDILICANTMQLYKELFDLTSEKINTKESITYYTKNEKLYIDAYHPAQTQVYRETYVDDIITAAKEWHELFK